MGHRLRAAGSRANRQRVAGHTGHDPSRRRPASVHDPRARAQRACPSPVRRQISPAAVQMFPAARQMSRHSAAPAASARSASAMTDSWASSASEPDGPHASSASTGCALDSSRDGTAYTADGCAGAIGGAGVVAGAPVGSSTTACRRTVDAGASGGGGGDARRCGVRQRPPRAVGAAVGADAHAERSTTTERRPRLRCIARTMLHESRGAFTRIPHNGRARWRWKCERASGNTPPPL